MTKSVENFNEIRLIKITYPFHFVPLVDVRLYVEADTNAFTMLMSFITENIK